MSILILNCEKTREAIGNSLTLNYTRPKPTVDLQILGETVGKKAVFGTATVTITGMASLPFTAGASLTFSGFATTANNKTVTLTSISGLVMTFPAATFTAATELQGTITDGTNTVNIAVSPDNPQVLTSLTSFDYLLRGKNLLRYPYTYSTIATSGITFTDNGDGSITINGTATADAYFNLAASGAPLRVKKGTHTVSGGLSTNVKVVAQKVASYVRGSDTGSGVTYTLAEDENEIAYILVINGYTASNIKVYPQLEKASSKSAWEAYQGVTASITLKDTSNNQLELRGIPATYNADGTVATWAAQSKVVKKADGKWYLQHNTSKLTDISGLAFGIYTTYATTGYTIFTTADFLRADGSALMCNILPVTNTADAGMASLTYSQVPKNVSSWKKFVFAVADSLTGVIGTDTDAQKITKLKTWWAANSGQIIHTPYTPNADTELSAADQTALNSVEKSFAGTTNIMLSDSKGQIYLKYKARR
jgi:hypothetical protein